MKIVINTCFGGFGLSQEAYQKLIEYGIPVVKYGEGSEADGEVIYDCELNNPNEGDIQKLNFMRIFTGRFYDFWLVANRSHPLLIKVVEELGGLASGRYARLKIVDIPGDIEYEIEHYDGIESIHELHRHWE